MKNNIENYEKINKLIKKHFYPELSRIKDNALEEFATKLLSIIMPEMNGIQSSRSGKHHPKDENKKDGFIKHCKRVAWWCIELCKEHDFSDETRDCMLVASLFHDIGRIHEIRDDGALRYLVEDLPTNIHPKTSWIMIQRVMKSFYEELDENDEKIKKIRRFIETHMHHWHSHNCPMPNTLEEFIFATADYVASRRQVKQPVLK